MDVFRVWFCVWFACLCLTHARQLTLRKGSDIFVLGTIPGAVSLFRTSRECTSAVVSSKDRCLNKILARDMRFELLENTHDAGLAKDLLDQCVSEDVVTMASSRCMGKIETSEQQLCAMLAPRTAERTAMASVYCRCTAHLNLDFTDFPITTYQRQKFACVTEEDFVEASSSGTERKDAPSREPEAESSLDSAGTVVSGAKSAVESALFARGSVADSAGTVDSAETMVSGYKSAVGSADESASFARGSVVDAAFDAAWAPEVESAVDSVPFEEEDEPNPAPVIRESVLYGVRYGTSDTSPLSLFADLETCRIAVMDRETRCLPYSIAKPIPVKVFSKRVYSDMLARKDDVSVILYPFAEASIVSAICKNVPAHARATYLPVHSWPGAADTEPQWFVCPAQGDVIPDDFSSFVHRVKRLPETVKHSNSAEDLFARQAVDSRTFLLELQQFTVQRARRMDQSMKLGFVGSGPSQTSFFIERVTLTIINPKLHMWGDIHGSIHSLLRTLQQIGVEDDWTLKNRRNVLIFLGDYVDRGDYGPEVLFVLMKLFNMNPNNILIVRGNHETRTLVESYGFGFQLQSRFKMDGDARLEVYKLFDLLPAALYLRDPSYDPLGAGQPEFYMFAHGGIQLSFDPTDFLAHSRDTLIVRLTFTEWNPAEAFALNIIRWADIGHKPLSSGGRSSTARNFFVSNLATDEPSSAETLTRQLDAALFEAESPFRLLESIQSPGFMWNDMTTDEYPIDRHRRVVFIADSNRGYVIPKTVVQNYLREYSIRAIFRAHQHSNSVDNFLRKLQRDNGLFAVYPTTEHRVTARADYHSIGWFTDVVPIGLSSAYTLNSSPNSGLGNNFDSYVTLDFETGGEPLFIHRFCFLPAPASNGIRPESPACWPQPAVVDTAVCRHIMQYGVEHGAAAVSLFASLEECEFATKKTVRCIPFLTTATLQSQPVTDLQAIAVERFKYADLTYPRVTADTASAVCAVSAETRPASGWFFPQFTTRFIRQWFICRDPSLLQSQTLSTFTGRVKAATEATLPQTNAKAIISHHEFMIQWREFWDNRVLRRQQFIPLDSSGCSHTESTVHVERIEVGNKESKIHIVGSLDGSIHSLIRIMHELGVEEDWTLKNRNDYVVFLGNYFLGSGYGLEGLYMIMRLFNMNRDNVILIRGVQETSLSHSAPFWEEMSSRFTEKFDYDTLGKTFDLMPAAVYIKDPTTVDSPRPQFLLFTSSGIQLSWDPAEFLAWGPLHRLVSVALCDRNKEVFASNVMKWGAVGPHTDLAIADATYLRARGIDGKEVDGRIVQIVQRSDTFKANLKSYRASLIGHMFDKDYANLERSERYGFMWNNFYDFYDEETKSPRFAVASTIRGMLISKRLLAAYMHENQILSVFKTYNRFDLPVLPTRKFVGAGGLATAFGEGFERVSVDTRNGWADTTMPVDRAPVWVLSSATESGLGFHFDSFVTLNWRTHTLTHHHCALPEPREESIPYRPAFDRCWPGPSAV